MDKAWKITDLGQYAKVGDAITAIQQQRLDVPIALPPRLGIPFEIVLPIVSRTMVRRWCTSRTYSDVLKQDHGIIIRWSTSSFRAFLCEQIR